MVGWREEMSENPSHFTKIDNERSFTIKQLSSLQKRTAGNCHATYVAKDKGRPTLFVNAAIEGTPEFPKTSIVDRRS